MKDTIKQLEKEVIDQIIREVKLSFLDKLAIWVITFKWPKQK